MVEEVPSREAIPEQLDALTEMDDVTLFLTDQELPFTQLLVASPEGEQVVIELEEEVVPRGLILNDTAESLEWAETTFQEQKQAAQRVQ